MTQLDLRPAKESEMAFVRSSWRQSSRPSSVRKSVWAKSMRVLMERLIPESDIVVACTPSVSDEVLGWVAVDAPRGLVHFVYVKEHMRGFGVARRLLQLVESRARPGNLIVRATAKTKAGGAIIRNTPWLEYDPLGFLEVLCTKSAA